MFQRNHDAVITSQLGCFVRKFEFNAAKWRAHSDSTLNILENTHLWPGGTVGYFQLAAQPANENNPQDKTGQI